MGMRWVGCVQNGYEKRRRDPASPGCNGLIRTSHRARSRVTQRSVLGAPGRRRRRLGRTLETSELGVLEFVIRPCSPIPLPPQSLQPVWRRLRTQERPPAVPESSAQQRPDTICELGWAKSASRISRHSDSTTQRHLILPIPSRRGPSYSPAQHVRCVNATNWPRRHPCAARRRVQCRAPEGKEIVRGTAQAALSRGTRWTREAGIKGGNGPADAETKGGGDKYEVSSRALVQCIAFPSQRLTDPKRSTDALPSLPTEVHANGALSRLGGHYDAPTSGLVVAVAQEETARASARHLSRGRGEVTRCNLLSGREQATITCHTCGCASGKASRPRDGHQIGCGATRLVCSIGGPAYPRTFLVLPPFPLPPLNEGGSCGNEEAVRRDSLAVIFQHPGCQYFQCQTISEDGRVVVP